MTGDISKKKLPSFTRPAFGNVSELNTDFAISHRLIIT